jgi:MSHA biogenesis protein MshG
MSTDFIYKARDKNGAEKLGVLRADNPVYVQDYLDAKNLIPIEIREKGRGVSGGWRSFFQKKIPLPELILFTRKLSALYRSGIPLTRSLQIIAEQHDSRIASIADKMRTDLERGDSFSEAISHYPHAFSDIYLNSIKVAEDSGRLDIVLERISDALERDFETREQIKTAIRYPVLVIVLVILAFFALVTFVVPRFAEFYGKHGAELPLPTQILIKINVLVTTYWYIPIALIFLFVPILLRLFRVEQFRKSFDSLILKTPVFGPLLNKIYISRFSHLLGVFYGSGAPLLAGLDTVGAAVGNRVIESEVGKIKRNIQEGNDLVRIKKDLPHFSSLALSMIQVGLESGSLEFMLQQVAAFFDREVDYTSKRLTALIEPFLIVFLGAVVLFLALSIFLPMWNLIEVFRPQ